MSDDGDDDDGSELITARTMRWGEHGGKKGRVNERVPYGETERVSRG